MSVTSLARAKEQYLEQKVGSASPAQLVTMLYDRLLVDVDRAAAAQDAGDHAAAGPHLTHAQRIVAELHGSLSDAWDGADDLRSIYTFLTGRLIAAHIQRDRAITAECRDIVAPLRDAWHQAAATTTTGTAPTAALA